MNIQCPRCPVQLSDKFELYQHLKTVHRINDSEAQRLSKSTGWYEQKSPTRDGDIAVDHRDAALRAQLEKSKMLNVPMISPSIKQDFKLPEGWIEGVDSIYTYMKEVMQHHDYDSTVEKVIEGKVTESYGILQLITYTRYLNNLRVLQEKEIVLSSRLAGLVVSDPEFPEVAKQLNTVKNDIAWARDEIEPEKNIELLLEDNWGRELEEAEMQKTQLEFMNKSNSEYARQKEKYNRQQAGTGFKEK